MGPLNEGSGDNSAVLQHIFQVDKVAVVHMLGKIVGIVEVDDSFVMGVHNLFGEKKAVGDIPGDVYKRQTLRWMIWHKPPV